MAEVTQLKRYDARPINWGKWFLIGIGMLVSAFILLVPMIYIFVQAFSKGLMPVLQNLADPDMLHAIWLTVMIALIAVPVNLVFGILLAWLVTRFNFPGRQLLLTLLDIPFAVSPVVAGLVYLLFYGSNGPLGGWLDKHISANYVLLARNGAGHHLCDVSVCGARAGAGDVKPGQPGRRSGDFAWRVWLADVSPRHIAEHSLGAALWRGVDQRPRDWRVWCSVGGFRLDSRRNTFAAVTD